MKRLMFSVLTCCCLLFAFGGATLIAGKSAVADEPKAKQAEAKQSDEEVELNDKEKAFQKMLTNATLVGKFTIVGRDTDKLKTEEYTILRVSKTSEKDVWVFMARIKYGTKDYTVPLPLTVKWADDTPMITLTDLTILGEGPFSARVIFHQNKYAGTWSHGEVGGHLFGTIEPGDDEKKTENKKQDTAE